jgi:hypothetical protein
MQILIESTISSRECFFELYREQEMVGQLKITRNESQNYDYEIETSEPWAEAYLLDHVSFLPEM